MKKIILCFFMILFVVYLPGCNPTDENLEDKTYYGELICQEIAISSWVTNMKVSIIDNNLYIEDELQGTLKQENIEKSFWNFEHILFSKDFENGENEFKDIDKGYIVETNVELEYQGSFYIVEKNNEKYLFFVVLTDDLRYEIVKGYYLSDYATLKFTSYSGGCLIFQDQKKVKIGTTFDLNLLSDNLFTSSFIDLKTLKVYTDYINVTENLDLIAYNNGVYDDYIIDYIFDNEDFVFSTKYYLIDEFKDYKYQVDAEKVIIVVNEVTYTFSKCLSLNQYYFLEEIKCNRNLFNDYHKAKNTLDILYGDTTYDSRYIDVELFNNNFIIKLAEPTLVG